MNVRTYLDKIRGWRDFLEGNHSTDEHFMLLDSLTHLIEAIDSIEPYIPDECHFAKHFAKVFEKQQFELDDWYALQEDLVMIFRAKILQVGKKKMHRNELKLLKYYEDHLAPEDYNSLSAIWYFLKLPILLQQEEHKKNYSGVAWQKWWDSQIKQI